MRTVGFIGAGNMATAIIRGIYNSKNINVDLLAYDLDEKKLSYLKEYDVLSVSSIKEVCTKSNFIFLSVKPQSFESVLSEVKGNITNSSVIVTIAAGITTDYICKAIGLNSKVIRIMPNTPLMVNCGASAISRNENVTDEEFELIRTIFNSAGITEEINEDKMNEIIAINGSTPAFVYLYAKYFIDFGKSVGIEDEVCKKLFAQTLVGSAKMIMNSGNDINKLIEQVSSKGGTTLEGLNVLYKNKLDETVKECCEATVKRAYELSK